MNVVIKIDECELSDSKHRPNMKTPVDSRKLEKELTSGVRNFVNTYGIPV